MLINFTVENFRSFRKPVSLRMEATSIKELNESILIKGDYKLLPVAVIYGANSSGKSNLLKAMAVMKSIVTNSSKLNPDDHLLYDPFMLDTESRNKPTEFEIQFIFHDSTYRYGFSYDRRRIISEYLFQTPREKQKEQQLFLRAEDEFSISDKLFAEGKGLEQKTLKNRLFLTVSAQFNGMVSQEVMRWFAQFNAINGLDSSGYDRITLNMLSEHIKGAEQALSFFRNTQLGFKDVRIKPETLSADALKSLDNLPAEVKSDVLERAKQGLVVGTYTVHDIRNDKGEIVREEEFREEEMESEGSKKIVEMSGPIFDTLLKGKVLLIDELDAKLHPILTRHVVRLFMDSSINKKGAQLIFNTHDTNLLNVKYVRRDQIWFTEKDQTDSTDLYSLVEFVDDSGKKVRNDSSLEKDYINGRYGAIPFIGGLNYGLK